LISHASKILVIAEGLENNAKMYQGEDQFGFRRAHSVRFANDKAMLSNTAKELQTLMSKLNDVTEECRMKINTKKTKIVVIVKGNKRVKIIINGDETEQVKQFRYLGSVITEDGLCDRGMKQELQ